MHPLRFPLDLATLLDYIQVASLVVLHTWVDGQDVCILLLSGVLFLHTSVDSQVR